MRPEAERIKIKTILVRAATVEAARQDAIRRGDDVAREAHERELQQLWHEHQEMESQVA